MAVDGTKSFDLDKFFKLKYGDSYISSNPFYYTQTNATPSVFLNAGDSNLARTSNSAYPSVFNQTGSIPSVQNPITASYGNMSTDDEKKDELSAAANVSAVNTANVAAVNNNTAVQGTSDTAAVNNTTAQTTAATESTAAAGSASALKPSTLGEIYENENGEMTEEQIQLAKAQARMIMVPTVNEAVKQEVLTQEEADKYLRGESDIPDEKGADFSKFCQGLRNNREKADSIYNETIEENENGEKTSNNPELESLYKQIISNEGVGSIVTNEELAQLKELAGKTEETEKPEETQMEERPADQEGKPGREEEVIAAYNAVMDAMESGQDLKSFAEQSGNADVKRIVSDIEDDGIVGNGAAAAQFESNVIQNAIQKRSQKACDNNQTATIGGKTVDYNGSYDQNDKKTTSSRKNKSSSSTSSSSSSTQTDKDKKPEEST